MRPKHTILLLDADEERMGRLAYALERRCEFNIYKFSAVFEVAAWLRDHRNADIRTLVADARTPQLLPEFLTTFQKLFTESKTLLIGYNSPKWMETTADAYLPNGCHSTAEIYERLHILCARKRGPKTTGYLPQAERKTA